MILPKCPPRMRLYFAHISCGYGDYFSYPFYSDYYENAYDDLFLSLKDRYGLEKARELYCRTFEVVRARNRGNC